jgi:phage FluMu gp28-like protein
MPPSSPTASSVSDLTRLQREGTRIPSGSFFLGVDLGKKHDYSVIAVVAKQPNHDQVRLVYFKRWPLETPYSAVIGSIRVIIDKLHNVQKCLVDQTGVGEYIVEDMQRGGIPNVEGVMLSQPTKQEILGHMRQLMQNQLFTYPFDIELTAEINVEHFELTKTGQVMFSHQDGTHDDILWAVALAVFATRAPPRPLFKPVTVTF